MRDQGFDSILVRRRADHKHAWLVTHGKPVGRLFISSPGDGRPFAFAGADLALDDVAHQCHGVTDFLLY